jgi:AcrR family transcriptional regulator
MPRSPAPDAAERIVDTVVPLFYRDGIHAVGMQRVIDECGCGKSLLYREFPSKDDLVAAYLERMRQTWLTTLQAELSKHPGNAREQIIDVVRAVGKDVGNPGYHGCAFLNAHAEFPGADHPVSRACVLHVTHIRNVVKQLAKQANLDDPDGLADRLTLVINGLRASGPLLGRKAVRCAVGLARDLVPHRPTFASSTVPTEK